MLSTRLGEWFRRYSVSINGLISRVSRATAMGSCGEKERRWMLKKILLVDKNHEYRHVLASLVRRGGYDVIHAAEVADAVKRLVSDRPDLIMIGDGVEIAGLKSSQFSVRIPMVIYGAQQTSIWLEEALSKGAVDILTKPISSVAVGEVLRKHLQTLRNRPRPIPSPRIA